MFDSILLYVVLTVLFLTVSIRFLIKRSIRKNLEEMKRQSKADLLKQKQIMLERIRTIPARKEELKRLVIDTQEKWNKHLNGNCPYIAIAWVHNGVGAANITSEAKFDLVEQSHDLVDIHAMKNLLLRDFPVFHKIVLKTWEVSQNGAVLGFYTPGKESDVDLNILSYIGELGHTGTYIAPAGENERGLYSVSFGLTNGQELSNRDKIEMRADAMRMYQIIEDSDYLLA